MIAGTPWFSLFKDKITTNLMNLLRPDIGVRITISFDVIFLHFVFVFRCSNNNIFVNCKAHMGAYLNQLETFLFCRAEASKSSMLHLCAQRARKAIPFQIRQNWNSVYSICFLFLPLRIECNCMCEYCAINLKHSEHQINGQYFFR